MRYMVLFFFFLSFLLNLPASDTLIIGNEYLSRKLVIDKEKGKISTHNLVYLPGAYDFHREPSFDFSFTVNDHEVNGLSGDFSIDRVMEREQGVYRIILSGKPGGIAEDLELYLSYRALPGEQGIKKDLMIKNNGKEPVILKNICVEDLNLDPWGGSNSVVYGNFGRNFYKPPYQGFHEDPALFVSGTKGTIILGNEAPGMTRYTGVFNSGSNRIRIGMRPEGNPYAVHIRLQPGDVFESPGTFLIFCPPDKEPASLLKDFVVRSMEVPFLNREEYPAYFYNTWVPFGTDISEELIKEIADSLQDCGAGYLIIDDGWQDYYGDWNAHPDKFPSGMKKIAGYIRDRGMKPGIWFSLCSVESSSEAFRKYSGLTIKNTEGEPRNLHGWANNLTFYSMDILTPWFDVMVEQTEKLIVDYGFEYLKIDLSFVKSAYITDPRLAGTYREGEEESNHEFFYPAYQRLLEYFDRIREKYPEVIIDCTYELWGDHHSIDYSLIQHAHVDWISNHTALPPEGSRDIRNLAWRQGNLIPTANMMIGNQQIHVPNHRFSFISGFAGIPMMLGDPRKLSREEKEWYSEMSAWFLKMQEKYNFMPFYSTEGFDKPGKYNWDGFIRFNPETRGGIICVFRNESPDEERSIPLPGLLEGNYEILDAEGVSLGVYTDSQLEEKGFQVKIKNINSARVLEIVTYAP